MNDSCHRSNSKYCLLPRGSFGSFGERNFSVFNFSIYVPFFDLSHEQLSLEEVLLAEAKASDPPSCLWKEGGGERYAMDRAALWVVDCLDSSI